MPLNGRITLAIGLKECFTSYEIERLSEQGFENIHIGAHISRVVTAVTDLISQLLLGA